MTVRLPLAVAAYMRLRIVVDDLDLTLVWVLGHQARNVLHSMQQRSYDTVQCPAACPTGPSWALSRRKQAAAACGEL
jgi:hypothetical protein